MVAARIRRRALGAGTVLDEAAATLGLRFERPALLSFLFHGLFESPAEIERDLAYPQEAFTTEALRALIVELAAAGYRFVSVADLERGLAPGGCYACLTFDDGYASNLRALPLLHEYGVPACVFVTTGHVEQGTRFWWDVVYAERRRRGTSAEAIEREMGKLKRQPSEHIQVYLENEFGPRAAQPRSDVDRPLRPDELRELAADPLVTIGNHTVGHSLLPLLPIEEAREQLLGAARYLEGVTGEAPRAVAYPNGDANEAVLGLVREVGAAFGFGVVPRRELVPLAPDRRLELGRFQLDGRRPLRRQLDVVRSRVQVANSARRLRRLVRGR